MSWRDVGDSASIRSDGAFIAVYTVKRDWELYERQTDGEYKLIGFARTAADARRKLAWPI